MLIGTSSAGTLVEKSGFAAGPVLEGLADQPLGLGVDEDQEEPLGLGEQLHQRVEDLGGDGVDLQLAGEVAGDLEDRLELDLGLDHARHGARARGVEDVKLGGLVVLALVDDHDLARVLGGPVGREAGGRTGTRRRRC